MLPVKEDILKRKWVTDFIPEFPFFEVLPEFFQFWTMIAENQQKTDQQLWAIKIQTHANRLNAFWTLQSVA